jgi:hypothetical protein
MISDILFHMALEAVGGAVTLYALSYCVHKRHQLLIWLIFAFLFSYITVLTIG